MEEIAQVYARALFEVATERDASDLVREQVGQFADALDESRELQMFFFSPYFSTEEKEDGLHKAVTGAHEAVVNFLSLLLENHRMPVIFRVRREYDRLWEDATGSFPSRSRAPSSSTRRSPSASATRSGVRQGVPWS
jgi:F0F1-type ATP synthase, delta subunit (mitochondrial oligomycin sensitivity protein)